MEKDKNPQKEREREKEKERNELEMQSINIKNYKYHRIPINPLRRIDTKKENFNNRPINIKMSDNLYFNKI